MRLIDADGIHYDDMLSSKGNGYYEHVGTVTDFEIDALPTVDAIPIEWIEKYLRNYRYMAPIEKCFVREMIKAWAERKEE